MWPVWANAISDVGPRERINPSHRRSFVLKALCDRQLSWAKATALGSWIVRSRVAPHLSHAAVAEAVLGAQSRAAQWQGALAVLRGLSRPSRRCTSAAITALARSGGSAWPRAAALLATARASTCSAACSARPRCWPGVCVCVSV